MAVGLTEVSTTKSHKPDKSNSRQETRMFSSVMSRTLQTENSKLG